MIMTGRGAHRRITALAVAGVMVAGLGFAGTARASLRWSKAYRLPGANQGISAISCPTAKLCVAAAAVGNASTTGTNDIFWTTNPRGGRKAWHRVALERSVQPQLGGDQEEIITDVSCAKSGGAIHCAAADGFANLWQTGSPASGQWSPQIPTYVGLLGVSCWSAYCAMLDANTNVAVQAGASPLSATSAILHPAESLSEGAIACNPSRLCAVSDHDHKLAWTTNAIAASPSWHHLALHGRAGVEGLGCPGGHLCVVAEGDGFHSLIGVWHPGAGGVRAAKLPAVDQSVYGVACPSTSFCAVSGSQSGVAGPGFVLTSSHPSASASAWHRQRVPVAFPAAIGCASASLCVVGDGQGGEISVGS